MRRLPVLATVLSTTLAAGLLVALPPAASGASTAAGPGAQGAPPAAGSPVLAAAAAPSAATGGAVTVGSVVLHPCSVLKGAYCGHVTRPWDPSGAVGGHLQIGFAFLPAGDSSRPALGTLAAHEGGPGYSTTGSGQDYADMYGPLLDRRNLLLVDQRGTGRSSPIACPALQSGAWPYAAPAARCARSLGDHDDLYGSALSSDDLAAVIRALGLGRVDLYGDSYGTFFAQVFAGRHPDLLRSVVLDSAYPTTGEDAWYATQGPAMLSSIDKVCARTPGCEVGGVPTSVLLQRVLAQVRAKPWHGVAYDADGVRHADVVVNGANLVTLAFGATYGPGWYRELPGALRSALAGYRAPLLRLVAEADYPDGSGGAVVDYSEGLDAAVTCHDYPQLYDMTAPPSVRRAQYAAAVREEERTDPGVYAPFTVQEYLDSFWEEQDWCLSWPVASPEHPAGPPAPPSGHYPDVPTLVLSGELDSITTPAEGALVAGQFPNARQVTVANSFHVTADGDADRCAVGVLRAFVTDPEHGLTPQVLACTSAVPPYRAVTDYLRSFRGATPATLAAGSAAVGTTARRAATTAALTVADVIDRWSNNYSEEGVGLHGGTFTYTGDLPTTFRLHGLRLTPDLAVSGTVTWHRYSHRIQVQLTVRQVDASGHPVAGSAADGTLTGSWDGRALGAVATLRGTLGGRSVVLTLPAP